jgi:tRNA-uridine 2-sulfurtransferase
VIGIPFYVWDMAERFRQDVVDDFVAEYAAGRTPNPCLRCNEKIKFAAVLDRALALGFDAVCTGHYARLDDNTLRRAADPGKDQSYVLAVLTRAQLSHSMFPLGDTHKNQVRAEAARRGLMVADKPDSHDVCFVADGDTRGFLARKLGDAPGSIVDETGAVVGDHDGTFGFTIGQRKGLRIGRPSTDGKPRYVLDIEPVTRTVTVGPAESLAISELTGERPVWTGCATPEEPLRCLVQLSAHGQPVECTAETINSTSEAINSTSETMNNGELRIRLDQPARGVAKGQAAVLYDGDTVLGSATIAATASTRVAVGSLSRLGDLPDVDDELVPVGRVNRHGNPDRGTCLVEAGSEDLEQGDVGRDLEELLLVSVREARGDPVAVASLLDARRLREVAQHTLLDVFRLQQERRLAGRDEVHRVEGRLQRPRDFVDVTLLMAADDLGVRWFPQSAADIEVRHLDLDPRYAPQRLTVRLRYRGQIGGAVLVDAAARIGGELGDERVDPLDHEGALARQRLDQADAGQSPDRVADRVA